MEFPRLLFAAEPLANCDISTKQRGYSGSIPMDGRDGDQGDEQNRDCCFHHSGAALLGRLGIQFHKEGVDIKLSKLAGLSPFSTRPSRLLKHRNHETFSPIHHPAHEYARYSQGYFRMPRGQVPSVIPSCEDADSVSALHPASSVVPG